jgi:hypothetical protein
MMKTTNPSPRCARASSSVLRYSIVFLFGAALVAAQSRITKPSAQTNSNTSGKRQHIATLRSSDSSEGSRVALTSDQSLNDYEAYRRGDRFYVKIPAVDVPRAEALRGRGFADVKAQRNGDSTVVSFRLPPGASARVEQRANRLDVVFTVAGGSSAASAMAGPKRTQSLSGPESRNANANKRSALPATVVNKNAADRSNPNTARNAGNSNSAVKTNSTSAPTTNSGSKAAATPLPSPLPSATARVPTPTPALKSSPTTIAAPTTQPTPATATNQAQKDWWGRLRERINYWILLAQLNPFPVAIGVVVLLLLIGLFLFQRKRAKTPRRVRPGLIKSTKTKTDAVPSVQPTSESAPLPVGTPAFADAAAVAGVMSVAAEPTEEIQEVKEMTPVPGAASAPLAAPDPRRERIARVTESTRNLLNGGDYEESIIGSSDPDTRQLVGGELLAAIVGRNVARRENARAAFMKHGYFDDATRDLRVADSENERAAAARRLSFVHDREATPHLVGALSDSSPDVRRAAVEALMDLRDPAAIAPLNSLMQSESDRKVPRPLIKQAIEACATASPEVPLVASPDSAVPESSFHSIETEREVIEL